MSNRQLEQIIDGVAAAYQAERTRSRTMVDLLIDEARREKTELHLRLQLQAEGLLKEWRERIAEIRNGEPGPPGKDGEPGPAGRARGTRATRAIPASPVSAAQMAVPAILALPGERGDKGDPGEPGAVPELTDELTLAVLEKVREDRLELDEKLFAATRRFERLSAELEERLASVKEGPPGPQGEPGRDGVDGRTGEARGLYAPGETYRKMDRVAHDGSEWIAMHDDPGPLPGDGWMLGAKGRKGKPGAGIQRAMAKDYTLVLETTDGKKLTVDLRGMFERYDEERGA